MVLWYFSSTGNSLHTARVIAEKTGGGNPKPIDSGVSEIDMTEACCIGFVFPVYLHDVPPIVRTFVSRIRFRENAYVFAVTTHNGECGSALVKFDRALRRRGASLSSGFDIKMPGNSVIIADLTSDEKEQTRRLSEAEIIIDEIARAVNERKIMKSPGGDTIRGSVMASFLRFITWIYRVHSRFWTNDACKKCGMCVRVCPVGNISMDTGGIRWKGRCLNCLACYHWCPVKAVELDGYTSARRRYHHPRVEYSDMIRR